MFHTRRRLYTGVSTTTSSLDASWIAASASWSFCHKTHPCWYQLDHIKSSKGACYEQSNMTCAEQQLHCLQTLQADRSPCLAASQ